MNWHELTPWLRPAMAAVVAVVIALVLHRLGRALVFRVLRFSTLLNFVATQCDRPAQFLMPLLALQAVWQGTPDNVPGIDAVRHFNGVLVIAGITWLALAAVSGVADGVIKLHPANVADNLHARRIQTQARVLSRTLMGGIVVAGVAFILLTFPGARQLGASLLASAGIAGLVAGIAAKSVFSNLIAGLQIALAQPIRIDDVLVINGEWGRVEEITGTYVVLNIWDERRLIIPLQWLIENPFQNWTRTSSEIIGTVFLWVAYGAPLDELRREAQRLCENAPEWDKRLCKLEVTEVSEQNMQLRLLVTSASSGQNWDLRCKVREGLLDFLARHHPGSLPHWRGHLQRRPSPELDFSKEAV